MKFGRRRIREEHATAAGVASPATTDSFDRSSLRRRGVVVVGRGGYADSGEGTGGGVAGGREGEEAGAEESFVSEQAQDASGDGERCFAFVRGLYRT